MALTALVVLLGVVVTIARRVAEEIEETLDGVKANDSVPVGHADASAKDVEAFNENDELVNVAMVDPSEVDNASDSSLLQYSSNGVVDIKIQLCLDDDTSDPKYCLTGGKIIVKAYDDNNREMEVHAIRAHLPTRIHYFFRSW
eukprot:CAMPEP_0117488956 /NCGR_PEP_ID=MMETSP0784-20121206/16785_1 /TAXON_ID=39447 /ORGANISM="" /LENGTH=142 /DNA_ID=CAMNT_0005283665 /DNA_START=74 /DNA_END=499 /DNA_ORIENTATION=-